MFSHFLDLSDVGQVKGSCLWAKLKIIYFKVTTNRGMQYVRFWKWCATTLLYIDSNLVFTFSLFWKIFSNGGHAEKPFYLFLKSRTQLHFLWSGFALIWKHFDKRKPNFRRDHTPPLLPQSSFANKNLFNSILKLNC